MRYEVLLKTTSAYTWGHNRRITLLSATSGSASAPRRSRDARAHSALLRLPRPQELPQCAVELMETERLLQHGHPARCRGVIGLGDSVTWRARHFGVWQRLTSKITALERPRHFRDTMTSGAFARFER